MLIVLYVKLASNKSIIYVIVIHNLNVSYCMIVLVEYGLKVVVVGMCFDLKVDELEGSYYCLIYGLFVIDVVVE